MMNLQQSSLTGLYTQHRELLRREPPNHNPLMCSHPATCPVCVAWREWAVQLVKVNREIAERETK
jgi:hypothetical protein